MLCWVHGIQNLWAVSVGHWMNWAVCSLQSRHLATGLQRTHLISCLSKSIFELTHLATAGAAGAAGAGIAAGAAGAAGVAAVTSSSLSRSLSTSLFIALQSSSTPVSEGSYAVEQSEVESSWNNCSYECVIHKSMSPVNYRWSMLVEAWVKHIQSHFCPLRPLWTYEMSSFSPPSLAPLHQRQPPLSLLPIHLLLHCRCMRIVQAIDHTTICSKFTTVIT